MAELKPVYLVSGDDDPKIDAWRARVRARAEAEGGPGALEAFDAVSAAPADVVASLMALTFATSTRYVLADAVERWKAGDLGPLEEAIGALPPDTVLVLVARGSAPARLVKAVEKAGGECRVYAAPKPWELPKWVSGRARDLGLHLDSDAAKALIGVAGQGQQRLTRELEKLAIAAHPRAQLSADEVEELAAGESSAGVYDLADALVAGDVQATLALAEELRRAEDRPSKLVFPIVRRLRDVHRAAELLDAGVPEGKVGAAMKLAPWQAKRTLAKARKADRDALARAICTFAELEIELRGGGAGLDEDTAFSLALARAATAA